VKNKTQKGFTLVELLIVISVTVIISSVIFAYLISARTTGQFTTIKSNLTKMIPQSDLLYDVPGDYSAVCTDSKINRMMETIINTGVTAKCYSNNQFGDVNLRWAVGVLMNTDVPLEAYSVTSSGVATWDEKGVNTLGVSSSPDIAMKWDEANAACLTAEGRLPTLEELKAVSDATLAASLDTINTIPSLTGSFYWSSTTSPSIQSNAYGVNMANGGIGNINKTKSYYVRCVHY
jgi:prepilin-type N-terminal cleavage/methylation domain-containing protein